MPAPTVEVTITLDDGNGTAYEGVVVTARLDQNDVYTAGDESFVISTLVTGTTDANGTVVLDLFPNHPTDGLGTTGSTWYFSARPPGASGWHYAAQIPNVACNLADLTNEPAPSNPTSFARSVRSALLTGLSTATNAVITGADTLLSAVGKLQAQISGFLTATVVAPTSSSTVLGETGGVVKRFAVDDLGPLVSVTRFGDTDTAAFYAAVAAGGVIDLNGATLDVTVTAQTTVSQNVHIRNGTINFTAATLLRVFKVTDCTLFRWENVNVTGNSNGTIDDSFDATSGTYSLMQIDPTSDGSVSNIQIDGGSFSGLIVIDDTKYQQGATGRFYYTGGYARNATFSSIPGHAFALNMADGFDIYGNSFASIGALCADFSTASKNCKFHHNRISVASGIGKAQSHMATHASNYVKNCEFYSNRASGLTSGNSSNVSVFKLNGVSNKAYDNEVEYAGGTAVESIEVYGSGYVARNKVKRTTNKLRSFVTTITDANLDAVFPNPVVLIEDNDPDGMYFFYRPQHTSVARVTVRGNKPTDLQKFLHGEASLNSPGMVIEGNESDSSATVAVGIHFAATTTNIDRLKVVGNTIKSQDTCLVAYNAEGACVSANTFENTKAGATAVFDILSTTSYSVTGNGGNIAWPSTSGEAIVSGNTQF